MKQVVTFLTVSLVSISLLNACGPSEEEIQQREQARQDSLEQVRQQQLQQQRQDSIQQARQDSIEAAQRGKERNSIEFDSDGAFSVQVEAWRSEVKAQQRVQEWQDRGYENTYVSKTGSEETGDVWFRIRLGHVATQEMADKLEAKARNNHEAKAWAVRVGNS